MYYSLFVYFLLLLLLYVWSYIAGKNYRKKGRVPYRMMFLSILCVSVVLGGRYDVGTDWGNYKYYYDHINTIDVFNSSLEPLYLLLNRIVAMTGLSSSFFFTIVSIIHLTLIYYVFRDTPKILPLGMALFILCLLPTSLNIVRQSIAICLFLFSIRYIKVSTIKYLFLIVLAGLFHYSAFILLPLFLLRNNIFIVLEKRYIAISLFIASYIAAPLLLPPLLNVIPIDILGAKYTGNLNNAEVEMVVNSGLGIMANNVLNVCVLFSAPVLSRFPKEKTYLLITYRLFLVGLVLSNIFGVSEFLSRLSLPLISLKVILLPYIIYALLHTYKKIEYLCGMMILFSYVLLFAFSVLNGAGGISPYIFRWV